MNAVKNTLLSWFVIQAMALTDVRVIVQNPRHLQKLITRESKNLSQFNALELDITPQQGECAGLELSNHTDELCQLNSKSITSFTRAPSALPLRSFITEPMN